MKENNMSDNKIELFAKQVKALNRGRDRYKIIFFVFLFGTIGIICAHLNYSDPLSFSSHGLFSSCFVMLCFAFSCVTFFLSEYLVVDGRDGQTAQILAESVCKVPFSLEKYFSFLRKKWLRLLLFIEAGMLVIVGAGMFVQKETETVSGSEEVNTVWHFLSLKEVSPETVFDAAGIAAFLAVLLGAAAAGTFAINKKVMISRYQKAVYGEERRERKASPKGKKKTKLIDVVIAVMIFGAMICIHSVVMVYPIEHLSVLEKGECYLSTLPELPGFVMMWTALYSCIFQLDDWNSYTGKWSSNWKPGKVIPGILILICAGLYGNTFYTAYTDDQITVNYMIYQKQYEWSDVKSYTIRKRSFGAESKIQMDLDMGDRTLHVLHNSTETSEEHSERFSSSNYEYVEMLVTRLDSLGVQGYIKDVDKLKADVLEISKDWDEGALGAFENIENIVEK